MAFEKPGQFFGRAARQGGHKQLFVAVIAVVALALAACTTTQPPTPGESDIREVLETAFENIEDRYAGDVTSRDLSIDGLNALADADPVLRIAVADETVSVIYDDRPLASWKSPPSRAYERWAALCANAMAVSLQESTTLSKQGREAALKRFFRGGLANLDQYTRYATPGEAGLTRARREGFGGLGITINYEEGRTSIRKVHTGTPAFKAGLQVGDTITHVGDIPLMGLSQRSVVARLRGPVHSLANLIVHRPGAPGPLKINVIRAHIILPTVETKQDGNILTIEISGFNQGTSRSLGKALADAEREMSGGLKGIVLDLRGNPGGLLDQAVAVADFFLNDGRIISTRGPHRRANQIFDASWGERVRKLPIVVLLNGRSASASEIVAAALRDSGRAVVVGASSFGKGSVQTIIRLPNGGELTLTWAHMIAPSGFSLQGHGIIPAICTSGEEERLGISRAMAEKNAAGLRFLRMHLAKRQVNRHDPNRARKLCPPSKEKPAEDLAVARFILGNLSIYNQSLKDGGPMIAEH